MPKDLRVEIRAVNGPLRAAREAAGWTQAELAAKAGRNSHEISEYECLKMNPLRPDGSWRPSALAIASAFGRPATDLFPAWIYEIRRPCVLREFNRDEVAALTATDPAWLSESSRTLQLPDGRIDRMETRIVVRQALATCTELEQDVLRLRFGFVDGEPKTLGEIAAILGGAVRIARPKRGTGAGPARQGLPLTRNRVQQIEAKALRKLRHPAVGLRAALAGDDPDGATDDE